MKFSDALDLCMKGRKIRRLDWNGKGMYIWFVPPHCIPIGLYRRHGTPDDPTPFEEEKGYVDIAGHFDMMNAQGIRIIGWVPSQTDLASGQWEVVEE